MEAIYARLILLIGGLKAVYCEGSFCPQCAMAYLVVPWPLHNHVLAMAPVEMGSEQQHYGCL